MSDKCDWQGHGFGAAYQDAACCDGEIGDLDDCEEPGGPIGLRGETCPQCGGDGQSAHPRRGPMALIRARLLARGLELCGAVADQELTAALAQEIRGWHELVNDLEAQLAIYQEAMCHTRIEDE